MAAVALTFFGWRPLTYPEVRLNEARFSQRSCHWSVQESQPSKLMFVKSLSSYPTGNDSGHWDVMTSLSNEISQSEKPLSTAEPL